MESSVPSIMFDRFASEEKIGSSSSSSKFDPSDPRKDGLSEAFKKAAHFYHELIKKRESAGHDMTPTYKNGECLRLLRGVRSPFDAGSFYVLGDSTTYDHEAPSTSFFGMRNKQEDVSKKSPENPTKAESAGELTKDERKQCSDVPSALEPNLTPMPEETEHKCLEEGTETANVCESTKDKKRKSFDVVAAPEQPDAKRPNVNTSFSEGEEEAADS